MFKKIKIVFQGGKTSEESVDLETICPHCELSMNPNVIYSVSNDLSNLEIGTFAAVIACTNPQCGKYHIQAFSYQRESRFNDISETHPIHYSYKPILHNDLPMTVNETFPHFRIIYDQALQAESMGLDQISGVGYRKAIEFLIKEYVIHQHPETADNVKSKFLGKVIDDNLTEFPKIQTLAKAAVWIGNDETHFVRVHDDKDIQDMKDLLTATALFISAELKVEEALEFTNRSK